MRKKTTVKIVYNKLPQIAAKLPAAVGEIVMKTAQSVADDAKLLMDEPKTGKIYRYGNVVHQASAPGEAPAKDTEHLSESIQVEQLSQSSAAVTVNAEYGGTLEFGGAHIAARPFMRPAAEKNREPFIEEMKKLEEKLK